ncbi:MAG: hypothetical protein U0414_42890 [Polyangiaceae bacterium]
MALRLVEELRRDSLMGIRFRAGRTWVGGEAYGTIACAIERGHIHVRCEGSSVGDACYSFTETETLDANTLYLPIGVDFDDLFRMGLVLHECTHAIQDYQRQTLGVIEAECAAYVAQASFFLVHGTTWEAVTREARLARHRSPTNPPMDRLITRSTTIATRVMHHRSEATLTESEMASLGEAISALPTYSDRVTESSTFDGL